VKKRVLSLVIALMLTTVFVSAAALFAYDTIFVTIDGDAVDFPDGLGPVIVDGRTLVPVRGVFEMLGFNVDWDDTAKAAVITNDEYEILITIDNHDFTVNGAGIALDVPAQLISERTMVPIRLPLESVGFYVDWDDYTRTVLIVSKAPIQTPPPAPTPVPVPFTGHRTADFAGGTFTGQWVDDVPNGHGTFTWYDGTIGTGEFVNGQMHGHGTVTWANGQSQTGILYRGLFQEAAYTPALDQPIQTAQLVGTWDSISIVGDSTFTNNTQRALNLIRAGAPQTYAMVLRYVGVIQQGTSSGMWAWLAPPTFVVGHATYTASATWYASAIVHDAIHSKQYHQHFEIHGYVPHEVWTGLDAEMEALAIQREFLVQINAPAHEISHIDWLRDNSIIWWDTTPWW